MIELIVSDRCTNCGECIAICPTNALDPGQAGPPILARVEDCQTCFMSELHCRADAIYVAIDVTDDMVVNDTAEAGSEDKTTWEDDSVEIFFDADHDLELGRGVGQFEGQYVFTANGAWRDNEANNPTFGRDADWFAATSKTSRGYQVEFKVKKTALFNPADGAVLGFHIAANDDDGSGRKAQLGWSGVAHHEYTYGALTLQAATSGGGGNKLTIKSIAVVGDKLQVSLSTGGTSGTPVLQGTPTINSPQWTDVPNAAFSTQGGVTTATFAKPTSSTEFYRVTVR